MQKVLNFTVPKPEVQGKGLDIDITMHPTSGDPDFRVVRLHEDGGFEVIATAVSFAGIERERLSAAENPPGTMLAVIILTGALNSRFRLSIEAYPADVAIATADLLVRICCWPFTIPGIDRSSFKAVVY